MGFRKCFWYLVIISIVAFFIGRLLPKGLFKADRFPFRPFRFEKNGQIYDKIKIKSWQNKLPDMSRILPKFIPAKNLSGNYRDRMPRMLQETCIAEFVHFNLCLSSLYCLWLWPGIGGAIIIILYVVIFHLPYIIIQRYNRPRLLKLARRISDREGARPKSKVVCVAVGRNTEGSDLSAVN